MIWWTNQPVPDPVTINISPGPGGFVVTDNGLATQPETLRDAEMAWAAAQQRRSWYNRMGLLVKVS